MTSRTRPGQARIVDVARVAGVSPQTVSNVVNERGGFAEPTRRKVLSAIALTGYKPNRAARQLRTQRTRHIGFPLQGRHPDPRNGFTLSFLKQVTAAARLSGHRIMVLTCEDGDSETFESWARDGEVDGFIFCYVTPGDYRTRILTALDVPFWVLGRTHPSEPQTWVDIDNRGAMASLVDYLVATGHSRIGYVGEAGTAHWTTERLEGARERLRAHGLDLVSEAVVRGSVEAVGAHLDELFASRHRPTALLTDSDAMAVQSVWRARAQGLRVGSDVAVTGFGAGLLEWLVDPPLTRVRIPMARIAEEVVSGLLRTVEGTPGPDRGVLVPTELVVARNAWRTVGVGEATAG